MKLIVESLDKKKKKVRKMFFIEELKKRIESMMFSLDIEKCNFKLEGKVELKNVEELACLFG